MDFKMNYIALSFMLLFACSNANKSAKTSPVHFHIDNAMPHCGGAAPLREDVYPKMDPFVSCTLFVFTVDSNGKRDKQIGSIVTDSQGNATLPLSAGKYQLWKPTKLLTLDEFQEVEKPLRGSVYEYRDEACFMAWYSRPDFEFELKDQKSFSFAYTNRCFTGAHPCLEYTGPYPP